MPSVLKTQQRQTCRAPSARWAPTLCFGTRGLGADKATSSHRPGLVSSGGHRLTMAATRVTTTVAPPVATIRGMARAGW